MIEQATDKKSPFRQRHGKTSINSGLRCKFHCLCDKINFHFLFANAQFTTSSRLRNTNHFIKKTPCVGSVYIEGDFGYFNGLETISVLHGLRKPIKC